MPPLGGRPVQIIQRGAEIPRDHFVAIRKLAVRMSTFSDSLWSRAADVCSFGEHLFTTTLPGGFGLSDLGSPRGPESRCRHRGTVLTSAPGVGAGFDTPTIIRGA